MPRGDGKFWLHINYTESDKETRTCLLWFYVKKMPFNGQIISKNNVRQMLVVLGITPLGQVS